MATPPDSALVVFGASGFIGTRLVQRLNEAHPGRVRAVDILPPRRRLEGVTYETHDVREPLPEALGVGASTFYNLAAVHRTPGHPFPEYYETNVLGALNVTALAEATRVDRIVFTSSISVYGPSENLLDEASPLKPVSAYGHSKRMAEVIHRQWQGFSPRRKLVIVRPGVVFGPGERGNYTHLAKALRGGYFVYPGRRDAIKSGGYVDELLRCLDFALDQDDPSILFNFAYPAQSTTEDIVKTFGRVAGLKARPPTIPTFAMLAAATGFEVLNAVGLKNPIHRERILKLVQSTKIEPGWLKARGYDFSTDLESALTRWRDETGGSFD